MDAYVKGETKDFNTVGVKALDDHTIQYTLVRPESFWNSKTTSGVLFPVNADFLKSQGKDFGSLKPSSILYNGPFYLKSLTSKSEIQLVKNKDYYDAKNVHIDNVKLTFNDGSNPDSIIKNFEKVNIPLHLLCQTVRLIRVSRKTLATTLSTVCNWEHPTILDSTWTVKSMTTLPKQRMNKSFYQESNLEQGLPSSGELWL